MRAMLIAVAITSVALGVIFATPAVWGAAVIVVLLQVVPAALVVGLVWGRGNFRVFCLGALIPAGLTLLFMSLVWVLSMFNPLARIGDMEGILRQYDSTHRRVAGLSWLCSVIVGVSCIGVRHVIVRWQFQPQPPTRVEEHLPGSENGGPAKAGAIDE
jgi:hypothetical protein